MDSVSGNDIEENKEGLSIIMIPINVFCGNCHWIFTRLHVFRMKCC